MPGRLISHDVVRDLYVRKKQSIKSIAKDFQVGRQAIQYALKRMGIKRRITKYHPKELRGNHE